MLVASGVALNVGGMRSSNLVLQSDHGKIEGSVPRQQIWIRRVPGLFIMLDGRLDAKRAGLGRETELVTTEGPPPSQPGQYTRINSRQRNAPPGVD